MESAKRVVAGGAWDHLLEEIVTMIAVKVAESLEAPLEDLRSLRLCNKVMKRACSSHIIANRFNLENHYRSTVWGEGGPISRTKIPFHPHCNPFPSTLQHPSKMESVKRDAVGGAWDRLPEEIIPMITINVAESTEAPLEDLCSLRAAR
jgi:hypothetical protein